MRKYFIVYGDRPSYEAAKDRLVREAEEVGCFDVIRKLGRSDVSDEVLNCPAMQVRRGGGLWAWKPDIILSTLQEMDDGDALVYCDAGCALRKSGEWPRIFDTLLNCDMILQRLCKYEIQWTRRELLEAFPDVARLAEKGLCQLMGTVVILRKSAFTVQFVAEWRRCIIEHYDWVRDVTPEERPHQRTVFIENRHDQSMLSVLAHHYALQGSGRIRIIWDRVEGRDLFFRQAIRSRRWIAPGKYPLRRDLEDVLRRCLRSFVLIPFLFARKEGNRFYGHRDVGLY